MLLCQQTGMLHQLCELMIVHNVALQQLYSFTVLPPFCENWWLKAVSLITLTYAVMSRLENNIWRRRWLELLSHRFPPFLALPGEPSMPWTSWIRSFETYIIALGLEDASDAREKTKIK